MAPSKSPLPPPINLLAGLLLASGPLAFGLFQAAAKRPDLVERFYAQGIYPTLTAVLSCAGAGLLPIATGEAALLLLLLGTGLGLFRWLRSLPADPRKAAVRAAKAALALACAGSGLYAAFVLAWGLNYRRPPLAETLAWPVEATRVEEIQALCEELVTQVNALKQGSRLEPDFNATARRAFKGYEALGASLAPALRERPSTPVKVAVFSALMSRSLTYGMALPWTHEALVNRDTPLAAAPFTICHEMAHQRGIAREDEANFVGYLAARLHPDADFQYSALRFALGETLSALARTHPKAAAELSARKDIAVVADEAEERAWVQRHRSCFSRLQGRTYDGYLKVQGQKDGIRSYGRVVDLLVAERRLRISGRLPGQL